MLRFVLVVVLAAVLVLIVGCHGTELQLGAGRTFNEFSGQGSNRRHDSVSNFSSFNFDQDDSTSAWVQLGFWLSPQSVVLKQEAPGALALSRYEGWNPWPDLPKLAESALGAAPEQATATLATLAAMQERLREMQERLRAMEEETKDHIGWTDLGLSGGTGAGGIGLLWMALQYRKRRREAANSSEESV